MRHLVWVGIAMLLTSTALSAQRAAEQAALLKYCDHIDSIAAPTPAGIQERTDCWKRVQLEGVTGALVEDRYRAAVRDYDRAMAADSLRRALAVREAQLDQQLALVAQAIARGSLVAADSMAQAVLTVQPANQRALAFRERVAALQQAARLRRTVTLVAGGVLTVSALLLVLAGVLAWRQQRAAEAERQRAATRTPMIRIIDGVGRGKMYTMTGPLFRVGSAQSDRPEEKNDLVLSDEAAYVSRYHCAILRREGRYYLIDSSLNGTSIDGVRLERGEPRLLDDGAEFTLSGVTRLKFLLV